MHPERFCSEGTPLSAAHRGSKDLLKLQTNGMFSAAGGILTGMLIIVCVFMYVFCVEILYIVIFAYCMYFVLKVFV